MERLEIRATTLSDNGIHEVIEPEPPTPLDRIEQLEEDQIRNLFDIGNRIGDTTCPQDVSDSIELATNVWMHSCLSERPSLLEGAQTRFRSCR